ncbi:MAG: hypothetical protein AB1742_01215 [bacterium]
MKHDSGCALRVAIFFVVTATLISGACGGVEQQAGAPPVERVLPADLVEKYRHYRESYRERHLYLGGTSEARLDEETKSAVVEYRALGDNQGWTGVSMAAFALQGDWELVRGNFSYWDAVELEPGKYERFPGVPDDYWSGETSIDQYGKMLMGLTAVYITGPRELRSRAAEITLEMIRYGKAHGWVMGWGPWADCGHIRYLFHLMSERMGLGEDVRKEGESVEEMREEFYMTLKQAPLIRQFAPGNYFTLNLFFERLITAKMLKPDLEGLDRAIGEWHRAVRKDGNALFDWFHARVFGKDTSFVVDELRKFPPELPNSWSATGYNVDYRWTRRPETWKKHAEEGPPGGSIEYAGVDFMALASFYSYFEVEDFRR